MDIYYISYVYYQLRLWIMAHITIKGFFVFLGYAN